MSKKKKSMVQLIEQAIEDNANKMSPTEVVVMMFKSALAAAISDNLIPKKGIPADLLPICKKQLISTFKKADLRNCPKTDEFFEGLFKVTLKEIMCLAEARSPRKTTIREKILMRELKFTEDVEYDPNTGLFMPIGGNGKKDKK